MRQEDTATGAKRMKAKTVFGDVGGRTALARCVYRRPVARLIAQPDNHRTLTERQRLGLDGAGFAIATSDRSAFDRSGRGVFTF